jgi:hypothetical protein
VWRSFVGVASFASISVAPYVAVAVILTWRGSYNVSKNYDHAINAFKKALERRSDDYALWNKLGATQANSNRNEEVSVVAVACRVPRMRT